MGAIYEVIIVGSGPAGLTAGLYTSRAGLSTLILEKETMGGELMNRDLIENYPGYPDGILGSQLGSNMVTQIMNCGAEIILDTVEKIDIREDYRVVETFQGNYWSSAMIIAEAARSSPNTTISLMGSK